MVAGQGLQSMLDRVPQLFTLVLSTQAVPQRCLPSGQAQLPETQFSPGAQAMPQPPQLLLSRLVSTQAPLQRRSPDSHNKQLPSVQASPGPQA